MKKNVGIILVGLLFIGLVISNLLFFKQNLALNKEINKIFELEADMSSLKVKHQTEVNTLKTDYENEINRITNEYTEKFETVKKELNAFEYEIEEFYKNKHILKEEYEKFKSSLDDVQKELD